MDGRSNSTNFEDFLQGNYFGPAYEDLFMGHL